MPRTRRLHAPGCAFHITARVQGRICLFNDEAIREHIVAYICDASASSTTRVIAYAVMPNHLHMVVRQGSQPLGWFVQRVLQRTALLIRRSYNHIDHVFGRRYWSDICDSAAYLRQAIVYTHLNPVRASLCKHASDYGTTSHNLYMGKAGAEGLATQIHWEHGLSFFASGDWDISGLRDDYMRFIQYWMRRPQLPLGSRYLFTEEEIPAAPRAEFGDEHWAAEYNDAVASAPRSSEVAIDIHERAVAVLRSLAPDLTIEQLRVGGRGKTIGTVRRQVIAALASMGCRNGAIARCLNVSTSHVSTVTAGIRQASSQ